MQMDEWIGDNVPDEVLEEAALWIARLDNESSNRYDRKKFARWLDKDPLHVRAYEELTPVWARLNTLGDVKRLSREGAVVSLLDHMPKGGQAQIRYTQNAPFWQVAVMLLLVFVGCFANLIQPDKSEDYQTSVGEQKWVTLSDGSKLHLNVNTKVTVAYSSTKRRISLQAGEALFQVAKDKDRPFVVETAYGDVTALGTEFLINARGNAAEVGVVEGVIEVTPGGEKSTLTEFDGAMVSLPLRQKLRLDKGKAATMVSGQVSAPSHWQVQKALDWQDGVLTVDQMTLKDIVALINSYGTLRLQVVNDALNEKNISGSFSPLSEAETLRFLRGLGVTLTPVRGHYFHLK